MKTIDLPLVWQTVDSSKKVLHLHGISDGDMSDGSEHREREGSICTVYIYIHIHIKIWNVVPVQACCQFL